jgi:anti-sigma regulatory factor (Ser/Thr protein kinase)
MGESRGVQQEAQAAATRTGGSVVLPCSPDSAAHARRHVTAVCQQSAQDQLCPAVQLVTTELVANAVRHARTGVRLSVRPTTTGMLVEVADDSPRMPERRDPGLFDESGRGLWLVDAMAARWGVERESPGKRVWAELTAGE